MGPCSVTITTCSHTVLPRLVLLLLLLQRVHELETTVAELRAAVATPPVVVASPRRGTTNKSARVAALETELAARDGDVAVLQNEPAGPRSGNAPSDEDVPLLQAALQQAKDVAVILQDELEAVTAELDEREDTIHSLQAELKAAKRAAKAGSRVGSPGGGSRVEQLTKMEVRRLKRQLQEAEGVIAELRASQPSDDHTDADPPTAADRLVGAASVPLHPTLARTNIHGACYSLSPDTDAVSHEALAKQAMAANDALTTAHDQLAEAQAQLSKEQAQLSEARTQLAEAQAQLSEAQAQTSHAKQAAASLRSDLQACQLERDDFAKQAEDAKTHAEAFR